MMHQHCITKPVSQFHQPPTTYLCKTVLNVIMILLMKQQFVIIHQYTILQETEKTWQTLNRPTLKHVMFSQNLGGSNFLSTQHFDRRCVFNPSV